MPSLRLSDAQAGLVEREGRSLLHVTTGHKEKWPGITILAPEGKWDLSPFAGIQLEARNTGIRPLTLHFRVDNPGADGINHCFTGSTRLEAGEVGTVWVEMKRTVDDKLDGKLFGLRGYPVKADREKALDAAAINQVLVFLSEPKEDSTFEILALEAKGRYVPPTAWSADASPFFPWIDSFGQYHHKSWPGKTRTEEELKSRRDAEGRALEGDRGPSQWNQYGGWLTGPTLKATGFFRVEKHQGKWWLVDPEGKLFWSHGIDCVRMLDTTPVEEREGWFLDFPGNKPEFAEFLLGGAYALKGHYAGRSPKCFSFAGANLKRKYGVEWRTSYPVLIHKRLRAWGLNTIANWSDMGVALMRVTPYTDTLGSHGSRMVEGSEGYWGKFPDVFDPGFRERLRQQMAAKRGKSAGDAWCLGYFSDNEMSWGDDVSLSLGTLASPSDQPAKRVFAADLKAKYTNIAELNLVWGTAFASWEDWLSSRARPDVAKAGADLRAFYSRTAETYFRTVREAIQETAPNQLYLGCRFAWANARAAAAAAKFCDVVSYNLYQRSIARFRAEGVGDVPLLIGEFHFGALDRGMLHTGLVSVSDQRARAEAYRDYVQGALRHPQFVGTHWFQYQDEPTLGRVYDEENYQIGFVDIADTPYAETVDMSRRIGEALYSLRTEQ